MSKVLLNCLPPTPAYKPGYSLSVIKSYLAARGYQADVKYWNLTLRGCISSFWYNQNNRVNLPWLFKDLMPFFAYYSITRKDETVTRRIEDFLKKYFPDETNIRAHINSSVELLINTIKSELRTIDICEYPYIYVQSKFYKYELISTGVFCEIIKNEYPSLITIIEAQEFPRKALALMDSFSCYDFATWGEYELPLSLLFESLSSVNPNLQSIPNIVYRNEKHEAVCSSTTLQEHINLESVPFADFSDYMEQTDVPISNIIFPLESGRGCHWNKCSFCYMNDGYSYRKKSSQRMTDEIRHYIEEYGAEYFYFIDNDMLGDNVPDFKVLLKEIITLKKTYPIKFEFGEVIAKDFDAEIAELISQSGFMEIQMGYESTSDISLKHINKKSHFADLILASRLCIEKGLNLTPQNILRSMPFETDEIILDNIKNLYFLRFLIGTGKFTHSLRELCVVSTSRYFKSFLKNGKLAEWDSTPMQDFMVSDLLKKEYKYDVFLMSTHKIHPLWQLFKETEAYYINNRYSYRFTENDSAVSYSEFCNDIEIRTIELTSYQIQILHHSKDETTTKDKLYNKTKIPLDILDKELNALKELGLIYLSETFEDIVSIVHL